VVEVISQSGAESLRRREVISSVEVNCVFAEESCRPRTKPRAETATPELEAMS